jgi:hypothetical protein
MTVTKASARRPINQTEKEISYRFPKCSEALTDTKQGHDARSRRHTTMAAFCRTGDDFSNHAVDFVTTSGDLVICLAGQRHALASGISLPVTLSVKSVPSVVKNTIAY